MFEGPLTRRILFFSLPWLFITLPATSLFAGAYLDSAHGSGTSGVFRPIIGNPPPSGFGYSKGNCAHCHEQHASIAGTEPVPTTGAASYELFAQNFNTAAKTGTYSESDNFCFYCHNDPTSAQSVINYDYSRNFGCAINGPTTVLGAMNQASYHNLWDVWDFSKNNFSWFTDYSNPCNACHNPHIAKRNWANPADPSFSAISKPDDHFNPVVWGTDNTMDSSYNTKYQSPYCSGTTFEPAGSSDAAASRASTPDYVAFCTTCHTTTNTIFSTTLNRNLEPIDWSSTGDKHGLRLMDGSVSTKEPFDTPSSGTNFVLSCLDCHEAHGSQNIMLLRRRANGSNLTSTITSSDGNEWGLLCLNCHIDDEANGSGNAIQWEYVHHKVSDAPYSQIQCSRCHSGGGGGPSPIPCLDCHYHGGKATKADKNGVYRIGF